MQIQQQQHCYVLSICSVNEYGIARCVGKRPCKKVGGLQDLTFLIGDDVAYSVWTTSFIKQHIICFSGIYLTIFKEKTLFQASFLKQITIL